MMVGPDRRFMDILADSQVYEKAIVHNVLKNACIACYNLVVLFQTKSHFRVADRPEENLSTMMPLLPDRRYSPELIDLPIENNSLSEYAGSLADIRKVNRFLGDYHAVLKYFSSLVSADAALLARPIKVLDVATGSADIPAAIVKWARRRGIQII